MATTGIFVDDKLFVLIGTVKFDHITSCSLTVGSETIDITSYDSSKRKDIVPGDTNWSVSLEAHYSQSATTTADDAISSEVSGDTSYGGNGYITNVTINSSKGSSTTVSISYEGTGELAIATVA